MVSLTEPFVLAPSCAADALFAEAFGLCCPNLVNTSTSVAKHFQLRYRRQTSAQRVAEVVKPIDPSSVFTERSGHRSEGRRVRRHDLVA